jgi:hypothetical protein
VRRLRVEGDVADFVDDNEGDSGEPVSLAGSVPGAFFDRTVELGPFARLTGAEVIERHIPGITAETWTWFATAVGTANLCPGSCHAAPAVAANEPETVIDTPWRRSEPPTPAPRPASDSLRHRR